MKTTWMFSIFMLLSISMVAAFADMPRKTPSEIPTPDEINDVKSEIAELTRDDIAAL